MGKSISDNQEIQPKVASTASVLTNGNHNAKIYRREEVNTLSSGNGNQHRELVNSIKEMVESLEPPSISHKSCCIYRIPTSVRKMNEEAYTPEVISIGPFYHGSKILEPMEKLKLKYFQRFLQRIDFNLEILVNAIKLHEESVRGCYAESIKLSSDDFVKLILVDGCFLIEFFYGLCFQGSQSAILEDHILLNPISWLAMMLDLQLLENQLPFFVLEILFSLACAPDGEYPSFTSLAIDLFERFHAQKLPQNLEADARHFADLARAFFLPSSRKLLRQRNFAGADHLYTASQLYQAGVKFKVGSSKCLLDLKFTSGTLEIPCIKLYNQTETSYRNVIAFEQCHYPYDSHFTDYIVLLSFLINTPKDVDLLIRKGIIINGLGSSNAVACFLNNLGTNVVYNGRNSAYCDLFEDLNAFYENPKHTWKATLKRDYFSTPWRIASTAAAGILLLLTLVQTVCSIIQVVKM
ncbi:hypothetical protein F2P56_019206 [Juglans regia]|uniref:UPF0481 protein At3g47200-like n=2 Tax=Juglans regia TaxID=51240 RepID=A0A2I4EA47_JUGRE|nr:UPF0481 protein At3g47200-like [Juglans regia]XP_035549330.1 UPF0481 protein At3g47200-like [Juglans regia]KAF5463283.1 hypothetical protein F2P56_019206 [Juglans regia]